MKGVTITGTGTGVGKTFVTRGLARALVRAGHAVAAVKPYETGCAPRPADADAIARASGHPALADDPSFHRAALPLAPFSATLRGAAPPPPIDEVAGSVRTRAAGIPVLVEGAGGLLVPLTAHETFADFAARLGFPLVLVAPNALGTISHTLAAVRAARDHRLVIRAVVLVEGERPDASATTNARALEAHLPGTPVVAFPRAPDDDDALADAIEASPLYELVRSTLLGI